MKLNVIIQSSTLIGLSFLIRSPKNGKILQSFNLALLLSFEARVLFASHNFAFILIAMDLPIAPVLYLCDTVPIPIKALVVAKVA